MDPPPPDLSPLPPPAVLPLPKRVLDQGHRNRGYITADPTHNDRARARLQGIKSAIAAAGLDPQSRSIAQAPYGIETGASAFARLMENTPRPTAVLCGNDVLAVGALRQAHSLRIAVPEQVSILGFDDIELAQVAYPALTTMRVPHRDMGRRAAQVLVGMVQDGVQARSQQLQPKIIMRDTLGPAPDAGAATLGGL